MSIRLAPRVLILCFLVCMMPTPAVPGGSSETVLHPTGDFWDRQAPESFRTRVATSEGDFVFEVHRSWSPIGVDRFYNLVRAGFFDDSRFYRVRADYIAQFGIPGDPAVSAVWRDRAMEDDPVVVSNLRGTIAYAMTGPDTRTTQLFITLVDNPHLDGQGFAPIGRVVAGMDVADRLYAGYDEDAGGGMRGGKQGKIFSGGNAHLDENFPDLTKLESVTLE